MIKIRRVQIRRGVHGVDVTVKSAHNLARYFAPTWEMVMGLKSYKLSEAEYTTAYHSILSHVPKEAWEWLAQQAVNDELTLLCYCRDGWFCHTYLLAAYAAKRFPTVFEDACASAITPA